MFPYWQTTRYRIGLDQPRVMGIVNLTPDSFFDGGAHPGLKEACLHCDKLVADGADILDIGGESSRPGAAALPVDEELRRVIPVVKYAVSLGVPISVDTYKPAVMQAALDLGADIINDIHALAQPQALQVVAAHPSCGLCLMHMCGEPSSMQQNVRYHSVVEEVNAFLAERVLACSAAGIVAERVVLDPGIGFGKLVEHNFELLRKQRQLMSLGRPLLVGWSRKSSLGAVTGRSVDERLAASLAASLAAVVHGARIVRVHDVAQTVDVLKVWAAAGLIPSN